MSSIDHRLAPSNPVLLSAPSKKSFSSASCAILAWRTLRPACPPSVRSRQHLRGPWQQVLFHSVIWVGWTQNCSAYSSSVLWPLTAAKASWSLEGRPVIASRSLHRLAPLVCHHPVVSVKPGYHLLTLSEFPGPLLSPRSMLSIKSGQPLSTFYEFKDIVSSTLRLLLFLPLASNLKARRVFPIAKGVLNRLECCGSITY